MSPGRLAVALALLMGLQPITTDLYLPALPAIKHDLGASMPSVQLTLSALILAFGLGQLFWGPIADRYGRRPVLLVGMLLYALSSLAATLAPDIHSLVTWRAVQGACTAAAVVCARSMVRDCCAPHEAVQVMSRGLTGLGLIALISPLTGGWLVQHIGFRAALAALAVAGSAILVFVVGSVSETLTQPNPQATRAGPMLRNWLLIARHPGFRAYAALTTGTYGGLYVFLSASSFVLIDTLGVARTTYGALMAGGSISYLCGTITCRRWAAQVGITATVARGAWCTLTAAVTVAALSLAGVHTVWSIVAPTWLYAFAHGIHQPCGQAGVVAPFPRHAGAASAFAGFILSFAAFLIGQVLSHVMNGTVYPLTLGLAAGGIFTALVGLTLVQRHGGPDQALGTTLPLNPAAAPTPGAASGLS